MPILWGSPLIDKPRLIQSLYHILWQGAFFQIAQIPLKLLQAADTNDNAIIAVHDFEGTVMYTPPQRRLQ